MSSRITNSLSDRPIRIASKVLDVNGGYAFAKEKDEIVLRKTPAARHEIKATFFEDNNNISTLTIQKFNSKSGPSDGYSFSFVGDEISQVLQFLINIKRLHLPDEQKVNLSDDQLEKFLLNPNQVIRLLSDNIEVIEELAQSGQLEKDLIAVGYRRSQLEIFLRLLGDDQYFENARTEQKTTKEGVWQKFFQKNSWIFGYGLTFQFLTALDDRKLEQTVRGASVANVGKRADALMKTQAHVSSLCYVEIKHHKTELLEKNLYRSGAWPTSRELTGAVAQSQATVQEAIEQYERELSPVDSMGNPTGEKLFNFQPRSLLVIGSMSEFESENGLNEQKFRSFELFRRNTYKPEILTFDELYHRAKYIVEHQG